MQCEPLKRGISVRYNFKIKPYAGYTRLLFIRAWLTSKIIADVSHWVLILNFLRLISLRMKASLDRLNAAIDKIKVEAKI